MPTFRSPSRPGPKPFYRYGPLYCFIARIPLYLGYAFDGFKAGTPVSPVAFLFQPTLTDSGVLVLLLSQHVAHGLLRVLSDLDILPALLGAFTPGWRLGG